MIIARIINNTGAVAALLPTILIARSVAIETSFPNTIVLTGFSDMKQALAEAERSANLSVLMTEVSCDSHGDNDCPYCY